MTKILDNYPEYYRICRVCRGSNEFYAWLSYDESTGYSQYSWNINTPTDILVSEVEDEDCWCYVKDI